MTDAFQLLILNLFVTGIALVTAGIGLRRVNQLDRATGDAERSE